MLATRLLVLTAEEQAQGVHVAGLAARPSLRSAAVAQKSWLRRGRSGHARSRDRREHRNLQHAQCGNAAEPTSARSAATRAISRDQQAGFKFLRRPKALRFRHHWLGHARYDRRGFNRRIYPGAARGPGPSRGRAALRMRRTEQR